MKSFWVVLLAAGVLFLSNMGAGFQAFAGDVIKPTLKGQEDKYRKAGDPQPLIEEDQEVEEGEEERPGVSQDERAAPRRGPHDDMQDRYGRRLGPEDELEDRYGRRGGRYDGRYDRPEGRFDGQDRRLDRRRGQPVEPWQPRDQLYGFSRYEKAPTPQVRVQQRRLRSHFMNHYRRSQYYRQAYDSSHSGRFRHFNDSRFRSDDSAQNRRARSSRFLPYRYR